MEKSSKTSPTTKGKGPTLTSINGRLCNAIEKYKGIRYDLDIEFRALDEMTVSDPPKVVMVDSATDTMLTPHWWTASTDEPKDMPLADLSLQPPRARTLGGHGPAPRAPGRAQRSYASAVVAAPAGTPSSTEMEDDGEYVTVRRRRWTEGPPGQGLPVGRISRRQL